MLGPMSVERRRGPARRPRRRSSSTVRRPGAPRRGAPPRAAAAAPAWSSSASGGAWRLAFPRPAGADRLEYLLELTYRTGRGASTADPTNPLRAPGPFGEKSVIEFPGYEQPEWVADDEAAPGTLRELPLESAAPARDAPDAPLVGRGHRSRAAAAAADRPRRARVRGLLVARPPARPPRRLRRGAGAARGAPAAAGRPQRVVLGVGALRERARGRRRAGRSLRAGADGPAAGADGREPRRARRAARALPQPRPRRRPLPPVGQLLPAALRHARGQASAASRGSRASSAQVHGRQRASRRASRRRSRAGCVEENLDNNRALAGALTRRGWDVRHVLAPRRAQLDRPGATRCTRTSPSCCCARGREPRATSSSAAARVCSRTATGAGRCSSFPSELGKRWDWEDSGMIGALAPLIDAGRVKVYCVDGADAWTWRADDVPLEERARRHGDYERWIAETVAPFIHADTGGGEIIVDGRELRRVPRRELRAEARRPLPARDLHERRLRRLASSAGASAATPSTSTTRWTTSSTWTATTSTGCARACRSCSSAGRASGRTRPARSSRRSASRALLGEKGIRHELDLWGHDVPHDWPSWRAQIAHHLPRFV